MKKKTPFQNVKNKFKAVTICSYSKNSNIPFIVLLAKVMNKKRLILKCNWLKKGQNDIVYFENTDMKHLNFPEKRNSPSFISDKTLCYIQPEFVNSFPLQIALLANLVYPGKIPPALLKLAHAHILH